MRAQYQHGKKPFLPSFQLIVVAITMLRRHLTLSTRHTRVPGPKYYIYVHDAGNHVVVHRWYADAINNSRGHLWSFVR